MKLHLNITSLVLFAMVGGCSSPTETAVQTRSVSEKTASPTTAAEARKAFLLQARSIDGLKGWR